MNFCHGFKDFYIEAASRVNILASTRASGAKDVRQSAARDG